jgi:glycosyltransferase involved in cell wall biosynthesis
MTQIAICNPFVNAFGGSEWRALELFSLLSERAEVSLWSNGPPDRELLGRFPIRQVGPGGVPSGRTFVFSGIYFPYEMFLRRAQAARVVAIYNTPTPHCLALRRNELAALGQPEPEFVFACKALKDSHPDVPGVVQPSPIDVARFSPGTPEPDRPFTVGRLSRDTHLKHHDSAPELYRALSEAGCRIRLMGAGCLSDKLDGVPGIQVLPAGSEPPETFLRSLDCFLYRASDKVFETFGRVVFEAMACGLPVAAYRKGGYAELIEEGRTGFLFDDDEEAIQTVLRLRDDAGLRQRVGQAARAAVERLYSPEVMESLVSYYLDGQTAVR